MPFKKGQKKTGGKEKGTSNKKTLILNSFAETIVDGGMDKFQAELTNLSGKQYVDAYMALFEYVKPKLNRTELTVPPETEIGLTITRKIIAKRD